MKVSIILVNWNGYKYTRDCLESLVNVKSPMFQAVVVDNGSTDSSVTKLREDFTDVIYLENKENLGFTGGNNVGIEWSLNNGFDYILLLNNDTVVKPNFLTELMNAFEANQEVGAVQPLIFAGSEGNAIWNGGSYINKWTGLTRTIKDDSKILNASKYVDWLTGCCILTSAEIIRKIGPLREEFFAYYEDVEWSMRLKEAGFKLLLQPTSQLHHIGGASGKKKSKENEGSVFPIIHYYNIRNQFWTITLHKKSFVLPSVYLILFGKVVIYCLYFLLRGKNKKLKMTLKGFREGITHKF